MRDLNPADETALQVLAVLHTLAHPAAEREPIPTSLEYERFVEQPRRQGINPVWRALLNEALTDNPQLAHKGAA